MYALEGLDSLYWHDLIWTYTYIYINTYALGTDIAYTTFEQWWIWKKLDQLKKIRMWLDFLVVFKDVSILCWFSAAWHDITVLCDAMLVLGTHAMHWLFGTMVCQALACILHDGGAVCWWGIGMVCMVPCRSAGVGLSNPWLFHIWTNFFNFLWFNV